MTSAQASHTAGAAAPGGTRVGVQEQHGHGEMSPFASPQIHTTNSSLGLAAFTEQTNLVPF